MNLRRYLLFIYLVLEYGLMLSSKYLFLLLLTKFSPNCPNDFVDEAIPSWIRAELREPGAGCCLGSDGDAVSLP